MKIEYVAHSGFVVTHKNVRIGFDLWLNNPVNPKNINEIEKLDYIFVSHDHDDHGYEESVELARRDSAYFVSIFELANKASRRGVAKTSPANAGGFFRVGDIEVKLTKAQHTTQTGIPVGFIVKIDDKIIFHMGDTDYFSELEFLGRIINFDVVFVPIGSRYTMGPKEACAAVQELKPKYTIPMHYNTFESIKRDPADFKKRVESTTNSQVKVMKPGETMILSI
jgi:L-ascorbate metabolism protein UlaG (beta-lactamase superfamily)